MRILMILSFVLTLSFLTNQADAKEGSRDERLQQLAEAYNLGAIEDQYRKAAEDALKEWREKGQPENLQEILKRHMDRIQIKAVELRSATPTQQADAGADGAAI